MIKMKRIQFLYSFFFFFISSIFSQWIQRQELLSNDGNYYDNFGTSVSVYDDYAMVGAPLKSVGKKITQGSVYFFHFNGKTWIQEQELLANDGDDYDNFGQSISIYGNYAMIGAPEKTIRKTIGQGVVYSFHFDGKIWIQQQELILKNGAFYDQFGYSVSIYGEYAIIGSYGKTNGSRVGAASVFYFNGKTWIQYQDLFPNEDIYYYFGHSVSIYQNYAIVGSYKTIGNNSYQQAAYIFEFNGKLWIQRQALTTTYNVTGEFFGYSVSLYGNYSVLGTWGRTTPNYITEGVAYIYYFNGSSWIQQQEIIGTSGSLFGLSVSLYESYVIIGAPYKTMENNTNQGAAYVYYFNGKTWIQQQELFASNGGSDDQFGSSVSTYGNYSIIGAWHKTIVKNSYQGAAYIFSHASKIFLKK